MSLQEKETLGKANKWLGSFEINVDSKKDPRNEM